MSLFAVGTLPVEKVDRGLLASEDLTPLGLVQVLACFAKREPGGAAAPRPQPLVNLSGRLLAPLAKHPTDGFADEELAVREKRFCQRRETVEHRLATAHG